MAYIEVRQNGKLIEQRQVNADKARRGLQISVGSRGKVFVKMGEPVVLGDYEVKVVEDPASNAMPNTHPQSFPTISQDLRNTSKNISPDQSEEPYPQIEDYTILEQLGEGGMGTVWRAVQLSTKREIALKTLAQRRSTAKKAQKRFKREVALAAKLTHPNIARIYDSGVHRGLYYYAMELIDGVQLDRYTWEQKLDHEAILKLMRKVCDALTSAHELGIVHCDLKPSNILVTSDGEPHVLDFGLARAFTKEDWNITISMDSEIIGTPAYMAPEQAAGHHQDIDEHTDVHSIGAILYQLLTGHLPRDMSGSRYEVLKRIVEEDVQNPREYDGSIDEELDTIVMTCLAREPKNRYSSIAALSEDIGRYLNKQPLAAGVMSSSQVCLIRMSPRKWAILTGMLSLILTVCFFYGHRFLLSKTQNSSVSESVDATNDILIPEDPQPLAIPKVLLSTFEVVLTPLTMKAHAGVMSPFILYDPEIPEDQERGPYRMWYMEYTKWTSGDHWIGHAYSQNGCEWINRQVVHTADPRGDIVSGDQRTDNPLVVKISDGYRLYHHRYYFEGPRPCSEWAGCTGMSSSSRDGIHYKEHVEHAMNPLYMAGGWDNYDVRPSSILQLDNAYVLYYTSAGDTGRFSTKPCLGGIGRAVSRDGIIWPSQLGPDRQMVLEAGEPGNWDRYVGEPSVVYRSRGTNMYWMFFRAGNEPGWTRGTGSIGFATSPDGIHWDNRTCLFNEAEWSELSNRVEGIIALANPHYFHDTRSEKEYLYFSYTYYNDAVEGPLANIGRVVLGP